MIKYLISTIVLLFQFTFAENSISIIATANVHGEIDPCGWKKKPLGGLARKSTVLSDYINENIYVVDAGNLFFSKELVDKGISTDAADVNANIILDSFNKMGCDIFSPGSKDFALGKNFLVDFSKKSKFPFISSNIYDDNDKLLFEPYVIDEKFGYKVAFIGLSSIFESDGLVVKDPLISLDKILDEVVPKSDIRILLFSSNDLDMKKLKANNPDLTMIIRSRNKQRASDGGAGIPTYTLGDKGKILYKFDIEINDLNKDFTDIAWCERTVKDSKNRLDKMKKGDMMADLKKIFKDNPATLNRIIRYENRILDANKKLESAVNKIFINKIELNKKINGDVDILKIVDKGKVKLKEIGAPDLHLHDHKHSHH